MRLEMHSRQEIIKANAADYQKATKKERGILLDRLVPVTGLNRDYLAWVLGQKQQEAATAGSRTKPAESNRHRASGAGGRRSTKLRLSSVF